MHIHNEYHAGLCDVQRQCSTSAVIVNWYFVFQNIVLIRFRTKVQPKSNLHKRVSEKNLKPEENSFWKRTCGCMKSYSAQTSRAATRRWTRVWLVSDTYPHTFRVVFQSVQPTEHRVPVLLPLPLAEDYFQEVPSPANQRDLEELVLGEHFRTLHTEEDPV